MGITLWINTWYPLANGCIQPTKNELAAGLTPRLSRLRQGIPGIIAKIHR